MGAMGYRRKSLLYLGLWFSLFVFAADASANTIDFTDNSVVFEIINRPNPAFADFGDASNMVAAILPYNAQDTWYSFQVTDINRLFLTLQFDDSGEMTEATIRGEVLGSTVNGGLYPGSWQFSMSYNTHFVDFDNETLALTVATDADVPGATVGSGFFQPLDGDTFGVPQHFQVPLWANDFDGLYFGLLPEASGLFRVFGWLEYDNGLGDIAASALVIHDSRPIPEPATAGLLGFGLLAARQFRRKIHLN